MHCHSSASQVSRLGMQRAVVSAWVAMDSVDTQAGLLDVFGRRGPTAHAAGHSPSRPRQIVRAAGAGDVPIL
jgi:hypothetical protein